MHSLKVLLVEDHAGEILLIRQILSRSSSPVRLHVAMDAEQALQILAEPQFKPDLIILDLNIPKIPGLALLAKCKPAAPVVVFSSCTNPAEVKKRLNLEYESSCANPV